MKFSAGKNPLRKLLRRLLKKQKRRPRRKHQKPNPDNISINDTTVVTIPEIAVF
jgi:hypothetical protein